MIIFFFLLCLISVTLEARPVSYPGGLTIMQMNNWKKNRLHVHYSPTHTDSFGLLYEYLRPEDSYVFNIQWNHLLTRRNTEFSQLNIYLKNQLGVISQSSAESFNGVISLASDWETRRFSLSYEVAISYLSKNNQIDFHQVARVGFAPYVAEYGNLHTWFIVQLEHHPDRNDQSLVSSFIVRMFKDDYLWEIGVDNNLSVVFNWVIRF